MSTYRKYRYDTSKSLHNRLTSLETTPDSIFWEFADEYTEIRTELRNRGEFNWKCPQCRFEWDTLYPQYKDNLSRHNFMREKKYKNLCPRCNYGEE